MNKSNEKYDSIDKYISQFPKDVQVKLKKIRNTIKKCAPKAKEDIKYGMPAFILNGNLVFFSAFDKHIGFYPFPSGVKEFQRFSEEYKTSKGAIQFPLNRPIPLNLVEKITKYRIKENAKDSDPFSSLSAPAQRALNNAGIKNVKQLSQFSEKDLLSLHGLGPSTLKALKKSGIKLKS